MTATTRIAAPTGTSGIYVEPWAPGEVYGVAADWAQASDPVMVYGRDGWTSDAHGRQVADFQHSPRAALASQLRAAIEMGGDDPDDDEIEATLAGAQDCIDADLDVMATMLERHGDRFSGNNSLDEAQGWIDEGFDCANADSWCEVGCWDAETAAKFRDAGVTPQQAHDAAESLTADLKDSAEAYTDGDPIYSACNGDTDVQEIIDAAKHV